ncbi:MAG: hypothetical protein A3D44_02480 [Candidatus Staskawiczbacteria bacterium RIFCSPHIGHO2_02_FULL_42_22]|uniref:Uncharacterized protein n=1 Tax=Candidatus Staskawiczbacteria bacterium RIFCSPHIGHO2_02_FULL_42_22 TaxID=1802207 RepID=A0A1G2I0B4_9BACT|nr:MAG: hypothetical protein A3D44_02480 [Candidatus Staskawiczbacteria bacterium RIFCSPHIGHO2_02_FULL_42_22]
MATKSLKKKLTIYNQPITDELIREMMDAEAGDVTIIDWSVKNQREYKCGVPGRRGDKHRGGATTPKGEEEYRILSTVIVTYTKN